MRSGLYNYTSAPELRESLDHDPTRVWTPQELLAIAFKRPAKAGTLKPNDDTGQNPSYAFAAGGVISTADDLAIWMHALVGGKLFDAKYQRQWLGSLEP